MTSSRSAAFSPVRRPPRRWWLPLKWLVVLAALVVVAAVVVASALWGYAWLRLPGDHVDALDGEVAALGAGGRSPAESTTVLVTLTEPVDPTVPDEPALVSGVALVQVGGPRDAVAVLILPQELAVREDRLLTDVQLDRGLDGLVQAVVDYTGIAVDHAVSATVDALPELVDLQGPVEVCTDRGCQELTGGAVRVMVAQGDDVAKARAIAAVVRSLADTVQARDVLLAPVASKRTIDVVAGQIKTDVALRGSALLDLAGVLTEGMELQVLTIPGIVDPDIGDLIVLPERAEVVFQHLREGTSPAPDEDLAAVPLDGVTVAVLNGAGVEGLAGRVAARLDDEGFTVAGTGNAPPYGFETTTVVYAPGSDAVRAAAIVLVERLGAGRLEPLETAPRHEGQTVDILVTAGLDLDEPAGDADGEGA